MSKLVSVPKVVLSKYATFSGRASRPEYWWWILALIIASAITGLIDGMIIAPMLGFEAFAENAGRPLTMLMSLAIFLPALGVSIRRLHDVDKSGWWVLVGLVPVVGALVLLYFYIQRGDEGANQFGEPEPLGAI